MLLGRTPARYAVLKTIFLTVVIREFLTGLNILDSHHKYPAFGNLCFAIRGA